MAPKDIGATSAQVRIDAGELKRLERLAELMDARYRIPGLNIRFGLDSLIGLVPGIGDGATAAVAGWLAFKAYRLGAPKRLLVLMLGNIAADALLGAIPLIGDIFDVGFKSNQRNVMLLKRHLEALPRRGDED